VEYQEEFSYLSTSGEDFSSIERSIVWQEELQAPLAKGDEVGACIYLLGGREIGRVPIVVSEEIHKAGYLDYLDELLGDWTL
jgi:D-alanyl-D-alanine carboxypeptidase (penicillin-binding protein 5/6)